MSLLDTSFPPKSILSQIHVVFYKCARAIIGEKQTILMEVTQCIWRHGVSLFSYNQKLQEQSYRNI